MRTARSIDWRTLKVLMSALPERVDDELREHFAFDA